MSYKTTITYTALKDSYYQIIKIKSLNGFILRTKWFLYCTKLLIEDCSDDVNLDNLEYSKDESDLENSDYDSTQKE